MSRDKTREDSSHEQILEGTQKPTAACGLEYDGTEFRVGPNSRVTFFLITVILAYLRGETPDRICAMPYDVLTLATSPRRPFWCLLPPQQSGRVQAYLQRPLPLEAVQLPVRLSSPPGPAANKREELPERTATNGKIFSASQASSVTPGTQIRPPSFVAFCADKLNLDLFRASRMSRSLRNSSRTRNSWGVGLPFQIRVVPHT